MLPPWGRPLPPRGLNARDYREWLAASQVFDARQRFVEVPDDDYYGRPPRVAIDAAPMNRSVYEDYYYEEDEAYYEPGGEAQLSLRQKEEELVASARRRIRRAKMLGESSVNLTREELDAYERQLAREAVPAGNKSKQPSRHSSSNSKSSPATSKKKSAATKKTAKPAERKISVPLTDLQDTPSPPPLLRQNSSPRATPRTASRRNSRPSSPSLAYLDRPSSRTSDTRSLPDDPDWQPRSRSSSINASGVNPLLYQVSGRRNVSSPAAVAYSSIRRVPVGAGDRRSSLSQQHLEEDEFAEQDLSQEEDDDDDEGVRVDTSLHDLHSGFTSIAPPRQSERRERDERDKEIRRRPVRR